MKGVKPRVGLTVATFANAIEALSELMTFGHEQHGGDWEGGRLSDPECIEKCEDSLIRHILARGRGELIDDGPKGSGMHHDVSEVANAMIKLERRLRDEMTKVKGV